MLCLSLFLFNFFSLWYCRFYPRWNTIDTTTAAARRRLGRSFYEVHHPVPPSFSLQTEYTTHMRHYTPLDILYSALFCDDKRDTISLCSIMQWLLLLHFCSLHVAWGLGRDIACQSVNIINKSPIVIPTLTSDFLIQRVCRRCVTTSRNLFACPSALKLTSRFWILLARGP